MDFASSTRAVEYRTRWKWVVVKPSVVPQRTCNATGLIGFMIGLRPRQGNLRLVFGLFSLMRGLSSIDLNNLKTGLGFPCQGINAIIDYFSHPFYITKQDIH